MTHPITRVEVLAAQALATDAPGPACDAVRSLSATLLEAIDKLKPFAEEHRQSIEHGTLVVLRFDWLNAADEFLRKFEGGG